MKFRLLLAIVVLASCGSIARGSGCTILTYSKTGDDKVYASSYGVQYIQKETENHIRFVDKPRCIRVSRQPLQKL